MKKEAKGCLWEYMYFLVTSPIWSVLLVILIILIISMLISLGD